MYPIEENMIVVPITKRMEIATSIKICLISQMNFDYKENGRKKVFLTNPKHQYRESQLENMIVVPITKRMEITVSIEVYPISRGSINYN